MIVCRTKDVESEQLKAVKEELMEYLKKSVRGLVGLCFLDYNG